MASESFIYEFVVVLGLLVKISCWVPLTLEVKCRPKLFFIVMYEFLKGKIV